MDKGKEKVHLGVIADVLSQLWRMAQQLPPDNKARGRLVDALRGVTGEIRRDAIIDKWSRGHSEDVKRGDKIRKLGRSAHVAFRQLKLGTGKARAIGVIEQAARTVVSNTMGTITPREISVDDHRNERLAAAEFLLAQLFIQPDEESRAEAIALTLYEWMCEWTDASMAGDIAGIARVAFSIPSARHVLTVLHEERMSKSEKGGKLGGRGRPNVKG